jgi:hypothetical protein
MKWEEYLELCFNKELQWLIANLNGGPTLIGGMSKCLRKITEDLLEKYHLSDHMLLNDRVTSARCQIGKLLTYVPLLTSGLYGGFIDQVMTQITEFGKKYHEITGEKLDVETLFWKNWPSRTVGEEMRIDEKLMNE